MAAATPLRAFYDDQIRLLEAGQIEQLISTHYTDDTVVLGNNGADFVVRCTGDQRPLVEHFRAYLAQIGKIRVESTDRFNETAGAVTFEATVLTEHFGRVRVYDSWVMRGGKIAVHFTGLFTPPAVNRAIIDRYYELVNKADWANWLTLFDDKVVGDEQIAGHFEGIDVLRGAGAAINKGYDPFRMTPLEIVIDGDQACVVWRCDSRNANKVPIAYPGDPNRPVIGINFFRFANGKIVYMRTVHDVIPFQPFVQQNRPFQGS